MEPFSEKPALHSMACPHCGEHNMVDDQAGGLHCPDCGHDQQMGWDDPESWMEGKFNWDFNLPLEGMAEGDEMLQPGEKNWVIPTREYGPRHHGGMEEWDTTTPYEEEPLYHGARSLKDAESIRTRGLSRGYLSSAQEEALQYSSEHPEHINPDEDFMLSGGGNLNNQEEHPEYESLGEMADRFGWGDVPSDTERVIGQGKSIGYRGVIPPEAITPGRYRNGEWTPLEEHTASWHFAGLNPRKLITTMQDHERGKKRWGFPKPRAFSFKRAAVDPDWLQKWMEVNGPYMTHQTDSEATRQKIEQEGLIPHDQGPGSQYDGTLVPRANHSYLARNLKSLSAYSRLGEGALKNSTVAVDLRKLDPNRINADEDAFDQNAPFREGDKPGLRGQLPRDVPWPRETRGDEPGFPGVHGVVDTEGNRFPNMGEWADRTNVTAPHHTAWSLNTMGHAAIEGGVHPEAIVPVDAARQDLEQNWPQVQLPDGYGPSHKVVPIAQPAEEQRAAHLIGEMRDGWGRFASGMPWQWGQWGKGIYYPETGTLQTWGDDRTHPEVALEDENATQGSGHHFVIRPNGTVKDQGAMDMNFESVEGDVPGLAQALREFDPRLRLDKPSDWDFGSTEPMEEEPSSVSRGEDGGQIHDVQTANDFAGSL